MGHLTCCGRGVELCDFVSLDEVPIPIRVGVRGDTLEHDGGGSIDQRAVHDVSVASDPSAICNACVHIAVLRNMREKSK